MSDPHAAMRVIEQLRLPDLLDQDLTSVSGDLYRIIMTASAHAVAWNRVRTFGPVGSRFDPQASGPPRTYPANGVAYLARSAETAVLEVFHSTRNIDAVSGAPVIYRMHMTEPLIVLDLTSGWASATGLDQTVNQLPTLASQLLARRLRARYPTLMGLRHRSVRDGRGENIVVWDPGRHSLESADLQDASPLQDSTWHGLILDIARRHRYHAIG